MSLLIRTMTAKEDGGVAIAHRSAIPECFGCIELVLTTTTHRFGARRVSLTSVSLDLSSSI